MKNIHLLPTDKARLYIHQGKLYDHKKTMHIADGTQIPQHIYITSNEEIKEGDWFYSPFQNEEKILKYNKFVIPFPKDKKIILTTDQDLIKVGVQAIDDEFLEWFVNNPSCDEVEVIYGLYNPSGRKVNFEILNQNHSQCVWKYKVIIPKEEPNYNGKLEIEWISNNKQCKQIESCYNSLSKKCICPKEEQKQHLIDMMKYDEELGLYEKPKREITLEEAGGIAAGLCQHLEAKEQAMFIAGFIECVKLQSNRTI